MTKSWTSASSARRFSTGPTAASSATAFNRSAAWRSTPPKSINSRSVALGRIARLVSVKSLPRATLFRGQCRPPRGVRDQGRRARDDQDDNAPPLSRRREGVARPKGRQRRRAEKFIPLRGWRGTRRRCGLGSFGSGSVFEPPARIAGLDDIAVVRQSVEHGGRHLGVAKHLRPVGERKIGGDQQRGVFVELADQMKQ